MLYTGTSAAFGAGPEELQQLWQHAAGEVAATDTATQPESAYQKAMRAYEEARYHDCFALITELFKGSPDSEELNFALGVSAYAIGKLSHAAVAFQRVCDLNPDNHRAKLELARTYTAMGQFTLAKEIFRRVLATEPPPGVQENIEQYLEKIALAERQWKSGVTVGAGVFFDDNVNFGPSERAVAIRPIAFGPLVFDELRVGDANRPKDSFGMFGSVEGRLEYDPGFRGQWGFYGTAGAYRSLLEGNASEFDTSLLRSSLGLRKSGYAHLIDARARVDYIERGMDKLATLAGADAGLAVAQNDKVRWSTTGSAEARNYDEGYDSYYAELGETRTRLVRNGQGAWSVTAAGFYENADDSAFDNLGGRLRLGGGVPVAYGATGSAGLSYRYTRYDEREALAPEDRRDHEWQLTLGLNRPVSERTNVDLSYSYTLSESSFDLYGYDRNLLTLSMETAF